MGVKLQELIIKDKIDYSTLERKIVAVDAPNIIMGLFTFAYKNKSYSQNELMTDSSQRVISHLYGLLFRINFYYSKKIFPIFCFDGRVPELKRIVTKDQLNDFKFTKNWYQQAIKSKNFDLARNIASSKEFLWPNIMEESKKLLNAIGVPYIDSPSSAEAQCAELVKRKVAHYSNSQDFDSLLFGCPKVLQNITKSLKRKVQNKWMYQKVTPISIDLDKNLKALNLSLFQLIDMSILIGTDFFPGITGIGLKKAFELVKTHENIETIIKKQNENYDFSHLSNDKINEIRQIFLFPEVLSEISFLRWDIPNPSKIIELTCEDHTLNKERVENNVSKLSKNYLACKSVFKSKKLVQKALNLE